ncbi:Gfo/Idh/MocA family protein [Paenibacillus sp. MBLB4367]|uniref:Gfo/Idh/MocA family protein n=1 Tax=Paenibacillus sp. MBLB4367 TaxID=3384767 RepID=UPI0039082F60
MKVAIVGGGGMGQAYAADLAKMNDIEVVGVCDINSASAERTAAICGSAAFSDFDAMLSQVEVDVVCVTLPTFLHKEYVIKAAEKGKHVICEKPIALDLADAREMIEACSRNHVKLFIGHVVRFFPSYSNLADAVKDGHIGSPGVAHLKRVGAFPQAAGRSWFADRKLSGGVILDLMIHDIDYICGLWGDVKSVYAMGRFSEEPKMEYALATLRFANGAIANLESYWGYPGPFSTAVELAGNGGILRYDSQQASSMTITKASEDGSPSMPVPHSPSKHDPYYEELRHFFSCIRDNKEPIVSAEDAYRAVEIALAAMQSIETGQPVRIGGNADA